MDTISNRGTEGGRRRMDFSLHNTNCLDFMADQSDESFDAIITDLPFSERTHAGFNALKCKKRRSKIEFEAITTDQVITIASELHRLARGWIVAFTDHAHFTLLADQLRLAGRYVFQPVGYVKPQYNVRLSGDGPASAIDWILVSRPSTRQFSRWGSTTGFYQWTSHWGKSRIVAGKPTGLLKCLVRDYTRPNEVVFDPFMGGGSTGEAAVLLGRKFVGCEIDRLRFALAERYVRHAHIHAESQFDF